MLRTRVITAAVLLLIVVGAIALGDAVFCAIMAAAFGLVVREWLSMTRLPQAASWAVGVVLAAAGVALSFMDFAPRGSIFLGLVLAVTAVWMAVLGVTYVARERGFGVAAVSSRILCIVLVPTAWMSLVWLMRAGGWPLMLSVFMLVWLADACAYFAGRLFGRHRMAPAISPKKTWEGAAGAFVCVLAAAFAAWLWLPHDVVFTSLILNRAGTAAGLIIIVLLTAVSIAGDLFESQLKRNAGVKDSSNMLPGHGGFYDRLDAALAVFPCAVAALLVI